MKESEVALHFAGEQAGEVVVVRARHRNFPVFSRDETNRVPGLQVVDWIEHRYVCDMPAGAQEGLAAGRPEVVGAQLRAHRRIAPRNLGRDPHLFRIPPRAVGQQVVDAARINLHAGAVEHIRIVRQLLVKIAVDFADHRVVIKVIRRRRRDLEAIHAVAVVMDVVG